MATATTNPLSLSSSSTLIDTSKAPRQPASASSQCVTLPTIPPPPLQWQSRLSRTAAYCRKVARNVASMATGDAPAAVASAEGPGEIATAETPEILKTILDTWNKVEDKVAVSSLVAAGTLGLWCSAGMISAVDRLPLIPGVFELVGIGYTGWFAYRNLVFKPDREAFLRKVKETYSEILGTS